MTLDERVLGILLQSPHIPLSPSIIVEFVGTDLAQVSDALRRLESEGRITQANGKWQVATTEDRLVD